MFVLLKQNKMLQCLIPEIVKLLKLRHSLHDYCTSPPTELRLHDSLLNNSLQCSFFIWKLAYPHWMVWYWLCDWSQFAPPRSWKNVFQGECDWYFSSNQQGNTGKCGSWSSLL